jgi:thiol-disulfide isomerase/thioredoxin
LRNELPHDRAFLQVKLKGTDCNRDAIGARVGLKLQDLDQPLIKTLRAGEGYLSQSSKWLHFGLGSAEASIESLTVNWPGGESQRVTGLKPNSRYLIEQGVASPRLLPARRQTVTLTPSTQPVPVATHAARVSLTTRIPAPRLPLVVAADPSPVDALQIAGGRPMLLTLWASWCGQCLEELTELARAANRIEQAGVTVLAVNVDDHFESTHSGDPSVRLGATGWPSSGSHFAAGTATGELVRRLRSLHDLPFGREVTMPLPMSFLFDARGELAVIYRGRIRLEQTLADVGHLTHAPAAWQATALPLPGRWSEQPSVTDLLQIPRQLLDREQTEDALQYVRQNEQRLAESREFPTLRAWLGDQLLRLGRAVEGRAQYELAIQAAPDDITLMNNLAWLLATHADDTIRDGAQAVRWAERAARATRAKEPGVLDTLAAAYAEAGQFDQALKAASRAADLARAAGQTERAQELENRARLYAGRQPYRQ